MNFDKGVISSKVMEFLEINLTLEEDKKNFARLLKGNKLLYKEANSFIETLLKAITIEDGKEDTPFVLRKVQDESIAVKKLSSINDSVKAWNLAPHSQKMQTNIHGAKKPLNNL